METFETGSKLRFSIINLFKSTGSSATFRFVNPIPAGVLENQDMLGGGQFDPPPQRILVSKYPSRDRVKRQNTKNV